MEQYLKISKWVKAGVVLFFFLATAICLNMTAMRQDRRVEQLNNMEYFKEFSLSGPNGENVTEETLKEAKVTVFNGWAPWCGPCTGEMPDLNKLNNEYKDKGLQIIGVVADYYQKGNEQYDQNIRDILDSTKVEYPIALADEAFNNSVTVTATGFPTTWVVDSEGNLIHTVPGAKSEEDWKELFDEWLEEVE